MLKKSFVKSFLLVVFLAILGGSISTFSKLSLQKIPPLTFTFLRFFLASMILFPFFVKNKIHWKGIWKVILVSFLATVNVMLFIFGLQKTTAPLATTLYVIVPLLVSVLSYFFLKEHLKKKKLFGIFLGVIGFSILLFIPLINNQERFHGDLLGNFLIFIAILSFSFYSVLSKKLQKEYTPFQLTFIFVVVTSILTFFFSFLEIKNPWWNNLSSASILSVIYVGVLGTGIFYLLYQYTIKRTTPLLTSMSLYLQPFAAVFFAYSFLGEGITTGFILGCILSLIGVWFVTSESLISKK